MYKSAFFQFDFFRISRQMISILWSVFAIPVRVQNFIWSWLALNWHSLLTTIIWASIFGSKVSSIFQNYLEIVLDAIDLHKCA